MLTFFFYFATAYVAVTLLAGGAGHLLRFPAFRRLVEGHAIVPRGLSWLVAAAVTLFELVAGGAAVAMLGRWRARGIALLLFLLCTLMGCIFALYLRRLLQEPQGTASCGCSPFSTPLTPAALAPALSLALVSLSGLAAGMLAPLGPVALPAAILSALWGVTVAALVIFYPAAIPASVVRGPS